MRLQVPAAVEELLGASWKQEDLLPLNGSPQEVAALRERMLLTRAAAKAKKSRKRAAAADGEAAVASVPSSALAIRANGSAGDLSDRWALKMIPSATAMPSPGSGAAGTLVTHLCSDEGHCFGAGVLAEAKQSPPVAGDASLAEEKAHAKKFKATEAAPAHASKEVWASIFTSSRPEAKETYGCRALSSRGLA